MWSVSIAFLLFPILTGAFPFVDYPDPRELKSSYWNSKAQESLKAAIEKKIIDKPAKNVILFIGDGLGLPVVTAARIYRGQTEKRASDQDPFVFENFPFAGLSRTYSVDKHTTDSASSATSYLGGTKTKYGTIGLGPTSSRGVCDEASRNDRVSSIASWAIDAGKQAGLVTSTRVTHATPASLFAHSPNRNWETDQDMEKLKALGDIPRDCEDIASQLMTGNTGKNLKVIMGGGRGNFLPTTQKGGKRLDGRNLIEDWKSSHSQGSYVQTRDELLKTDLKNTESLLGLFTMSHMPYELAKPANSTAPNLVEMTKAAIQILQNDDKGFFLLVEGGRIDHALHYSKAKLALEETVWFNKAIEAAHEMTDEEETLIVVTADHSHAMDIGGYPARKHHILGYHNASYTKHTLYPDIEFENLPSPIITFANGPNGINVTHPRRDLTNEDMMRDQYQQDSFIGRSYETHGGEDVGIWARGPMAHLLSGTIDDNFIPHVMSYALCVGPSKQLCDDESLRKTLVEPLPVQQAGPSENTQKAILAFAILCFILLLLLVAIALYWLLKYSGTTNNSKSGRTNLALTPDP